MFVHKALILSLILSFNLFAIDDHKKLVDSISQHAIIFGTGPDKTYAFIDPLCSKSKTYVQRIFLSDELQEQKTFYIFLYRLNKFKSDQIIEFIYQSADPKEALVSIVIEDDLEIMKDNFIANEKTVNIIKDISDVAKQMKMKYRPYILLFEEGSKYCQVSEGTAPCMEEFDFSE